MEMKRVLVTATNYDKLCEEGLQLLKDSGCEVILNSKGRMYTRAEMEAVVGNIHGIVAHCEEWDDALFDLAPNLQVIARFGVGYDSIDLEAAKRHGVHITNCPGINANAVAEMTVSLLMALVREIPQLNEATKAGTWTRTIFSELPGKRVGLLGFGAIAQKTAKKLKGFGVDIQVYNRSLKLELAEALGVRITTDLDEVLSTSDYILIHLPVTPETRGLINWETINKMKHGVYLVNTARGALVNEVDVYEALASGKIKGMATDVYAQEPVRPDNPLLTLPNFIGTPHCAGETYENYRETGLSTAKAVIDVFEGRTPWNQLV